MCGRPGLPKRKPRASHSNRFVLYSFKCCLLAWLIDLICFLKPSVCYAYLFFINEFYLIVMFYALINVYVHVSRLFWATQMQLHVSQRHQLTTSSWVALGTVRASFGTWISCRLSPSWGAIGLLSQRSASTSLLWVNNNVNRITWVTSVVCKLHSSFLLAFNKHSLHCMVFAFVCFIRVIK